MPWICIGIQNPSSKSAAPFPSVSASLRHYKPAANSGDPTVDRCILVISMQQSSIPDQRSIDTFAIDFRIPSTVNSPSFWVSTSYGLCRRV